MSDDYPDKDPFRAEDPRAAEREARRREREARRKQRSTGARRSLGERVTGAIGAVTGVGESGEQPPTAEPPAVEKPLGPTPPAGAEPPAVTEPPGPTPPAAAEPPATTKPAATSPAASAPSATPPTRSSPARPAPGSGAAEPGAGAGDRPPPAASPSAPSPSAPSGAGSADDDWLSGPDAWNPDTSDWLAAVGEDQPSSGTSESGAIGSEPGSITGESRSITGESGSITGDYVPVTGESGSITGDYVPVTGEGAAITGDRPAVAAGAGAGARSGVPIAALRPRDPRSLWTRRAIALGIVLVALGAIVLLAKATLGGSDEPEPVSKGPKTLKTTDVVVPEGLTIAQISDVAKKAGLKGDYEKAVDKAANKFPLKKYDASDAPSMEGFLFPATYEIEKGAPVGDLVAKQLEAFQQYFDPIDMKYAEKKNLTPYDVLKIASMVEEEVQVDQERPLVAAVIYNRLKAGDTLGIDATLRYGLDKYDGQLLESELESDNPYNSRVIAGLPPTPIANPGQASMEAAAKPAKTDDYFFVVKPGTCGEHFFTDSAEEFDQAAAEYQQALQEQGGSPTEC